MICEKNIKTEMTVYASVKDNKSKHIRDYVSAYNVMLCQQIEHWDDCMLALKNPNQNTQEVKNERFFLNIDKTKTMCECLGIRCL